MHIGCTRDPVTGHDPNTGCHWSVDTSFLDDNLAKSGNARDGTPLAMAPRMRKDPITDLLIEIQQIIDSACEELVARNRHDIAQCIRRDSAWIPPIEDLRRGVLPSPRIELRKLRPLLYDALEEGLVDARHFDALMIERALAERALASEES